MELFDYNPEILAFLELYEFWTNNGNDVIVW